jgi:hypothetical protein
MEKKIISILNLPYEKICFEGHYHNPEIQVSKTLYQGA